MAQSPSLRSRALKLIARREYSRRELSARLAAHADNPEELEALLDEFERDGWLSEKRLVEALVHTRRSRYGSARVLHELKGKGVSENGLERARQALAAGELEAARTVWQKKFGRLPKNLAERAKQARFLAGRGFSAEVVHKLLKGHEE